MRYGFDTSAWVDGWVRFYPPDIFPSVWTKLDEMVDEGRIAISEEVLVELERKEDDLFSWAKERRGSMVVPSDQPVQESVREILAQHPKIIDTRANRSGADPFVIATARVHGLTVVTGERPSGNPRKRPNIPDVCESFGVPWMNLLDFLRSERWRF